MIVVKLWITSKSVEHYPKYKSGYRKYWKGLFLFGILPLWIENTKTDYIL